MNTKNVKLSDNSSLFFDFINESSEIIFIIDQNKLTIEYANLQASKILGFSQEEFENMPLDNILSELDLEKLGVGLIRQKDKLGSYSLLTSKTQEHFYVRTSYTTHEHDGKSHTIIISRDITEKIKKELLLSSKIQQNQQDLENQRIFSDTLINNAPIPIFYKNSNGEYLGANKAWEEMTGLSEKDVIGKSVYDIAPKEIADIYYEQDEKVFTLEENPQIYQWKVNNQLKKETYDVIFHKSAYFDSDSNVIGLIGIVTDITDMTKLKYEKEEKERLIYHQSKMAAMGEMLENIAHQWRQPLSIISTSATGLQMQQEFDLLTQEELSKAIDNIFESSQYLSQTIDDFRYFFKTDKKKNSFNSQSIFERTLKLLSSKFVNNDLTLLTDIQECMLYTYENELTHVIINILNNAADVLNQKNKEEKIIQVTAYEKEAHFIITIQDNAEGVPTEIIDRIFEPYFTTKHQTQGTGIGLYMSQEIVKKHLDGLLEVSNKRFTYKNYDYVGAMFTITIPLEHEPVDYSI